MGYFDPKMDGHFSDLVMWEDQVWKTSMQFGLEGEIHFIQYIATPKWIKKSWTPLKYVESIIYTIPETLSIFLGVLIL